MNRVQERHAEEAKQGPGEWLECQCDKCEVKRQTIANVIKHIKGHDTDEERAEALYYFGFLVDVKIKG